MDDNTQDQIAYDDAVMQIRDAVRELRAAGTNFDDKGVRTAFKKKLVDTMKRVSKDKRIFQ